MTPYAVACAVACLLLAGCFVRLRTQRGHSADRRCTTCIFAMVACLAISVFPLLPTPFRLQLPATPTLSVPLARFAEAAGREVYRYEPKTTDLRLSGSISNVATTNAGEWLTRITRFGGFGVICWWCLGAVAALRFFGRSEDAPSRVLVMSRYRVKLVRGLKVPACLGGPRPVVLLPVESIDRSPWQLEAIIRHEEAHISRGDHFWISLGYVLCAFQWFNPLAWLLLRRFRLESEIAADDAVLLSGCRASDYAELLLDFNTQSKTNLSPMFAPMLIAKSGFANRLQAVLSPANTRNLMNYRQKTRSILAAGLFGMALAAIVAAHPADSVLKRNGGSWLPETRRMELVQVGMKDAEHGVVVWDSAGDMVPASRVIDHPWLPDNVSPKGYVERYRHLVFRVEAKPGDENPETAVGSPLQAPEAEPEFDAKGYADSEYLYTRNGWHYFVDHLFISPTLSEVRGWVSDDSQKLQVIKSTPPPVKDYGFGSLPPTNAGVYATVEKPIDMGSVPIPGRFHQTRKLEGVDGGYV
jgi:hypothetical protein